MRGALSTKVFGTSMSRRGTTSSGTCANWNGAPSKLPNGGADVFCNLNLEQPWITNPLQPQAQPTTMSHGRSKLEDATVGMPDELCAPIGQSAQPGLAMFKVHGSAHVPLILNPSRLTCINGESHQLDH